MKKNRLVTTSILALSTIALLIGCGSDGGSDKPEKKTFDDLSKISSNFNQSSRVQQAQNSRVTTTKMSKKLKKHSTNSFKKISTNNKIEEYECPLGGSYTYEERSDVIIENNSECIYTDKETGLNVYENGKVAYYTNEDKLIYENYAYAGDTTNLDSEGYYVGWVAEYLETIYKESNNLINMRIHGGTIDYLKDQPAEHMTYTNFIIKNNTSNNSWYYEGSYTFKVSCYSEQYSMKTKDDDWLIESGDFYTKGTIDINNIRYSYNGSQVTLSTQDEEGIFEQDELAKKLEEKINDSINKCSI
jgi:hypothetical protein